MERQPRRRKRPALSCLECRRRKIKCDRNDPCAHCVSAKITCTYNFYSSDPVIRQQLRQRGSTSRSPSAHPPSPLPAHRPITEHPNLSTEAQIAVPPVPVLEQSGTSNPRRPNPTRDAEPDLYELLQRVNNLEQSSASNPVHGLSKTGRDILSRQLGLQDSQVILNKTRLLRWSHWVGMGHGEMDIILGCFAVALGDGKVTSFQGAETRALLVQIRDLLQNCKNVAKSIKVGWPNRGLSCPETDLSPPSREVADTMATLYFRCFESTHRILHAPTFWTEYQRYWDHPEGVTLNLRLKILLVIGVGSSVYQHGDMEPGFRSKVHHWVYAAQAWLSGPLKKDRLDISGLQIHCLTILARQTFSIGGDLVWMSMGSLVHRAMQIGLHRDPKHLPAMSALHSECRRRLWATILEMVVQSSLDSAMPPRISFDEFDTEAPSNINDEEIDESIMALQPHPKDTFTTTSMQLILLNSLPTRLRILQLLNGLHSDLSYLDVLALSSEITDACRAYSSFMKEHEASGVTPFHRNLLDYLVRRFLIPLHCAFASQGRKNPLFYYSLKISVDTAMVIISPEPDEGFSRLMAIGGGMFREGIRYATSVLSLELLAQAEAQRLDGTLHRNYVYRELLKQAVKALLSLSTERIRQGETNIKAHTFLSMVMAQVEATEADTPCEFKVAQSARDSLEFCHDLLRTRVSTASLPSPDDTGLSSMSFDGGHQSYGLDFELDFFLPDVDFP